MLLLHHYRPFAMLLVKIEGSGAKSDSPSNRNNFHLTLSRCLCYDTNDEVYK